MDRTTGEMQCRRMMRESSEHPLPEMIELVKSVLTGTVPDENLFSQTNGSFWDCLMQHAIEQGVIAIALEGAIRLPKALQPPQTLKWQWIAHVESIEKRYKRQMEAAQELNAYFAENSIRMLLFKGLALSRFYPTPEHREFGDIDIYLCEKSADGDRLLKQFVKQGDSPNKKHTCFFHKGIMIENHHSVFVKNMPHSFLEKHLKEMLDSAGIPGDESFNSPGAVNEKPDQSLLFPPPDFDALVVMVHTLKHFTAKVVLRQLCDLAVLFKAHQGKIDFPRYRKLLAEAGLLKAADAFTSLTVRFLGLDPECVPPYEQDKPLEDKIWEDILCPPVPLLPKEKRNLFNSIVYKTKLLQANYWKYELISPGEFKKRVLRSLGYHLIHPEKIRL